MRTDQIITRRRVLRGAGVAATGVAVAALGANSAAAEPREDGSPVGSWLVTITGPHVPTTTVLAAYAAGGVYTEINLTPTSTYTALGTWARTGGHTFTATFWQLANNTFFPPPPEQVVFRVTLDGQVSGDDLATTFTFDVFDPSHLPPAKPLFSGSGQATGQRVKP